MTIISCNAQIYPLRTYKFNFPLGSYQKDINNELPSYEGTWKGNWNGKDIYITFIKIKYYHSEYYSDILVGKFKIYDYYGNILFDNTNLDNNNSKIKGMTFFNRNGEKYRLDYLDNDLCGLNGYIDINFTDSTKTKLNFKFNEGSNLITKDCPYYNSPEFPQPLPKEIILTKQ